jgi:predicted amidohydrolase
MQIKIAAAQLELSVDDPASNSTKLKQAIREAAKNGAELILLPELSNSGYAFRSREQALENCWQIDGPEIRELELLVSVLNIVLVAGFGIIEGNTLKNCSVIIDSGGLLGVYTKAHLWGNEPDFFVRGETAPLVVQTDLGRIGTVICYDAEFPEWIRYSMLAGAQLLAIPTNWPDTGLPRKPIPLEVVRIQAAASQNKLAIAACDRTGDENGIHWVSSSVIVDSNGVIQSLASSRGEEIIYSEVELPTDDVIGPRNSIKADRRIDLYQRFPII